jgi:hypothetical protein
MRVLISVSLTAVFATSLLYAGDVVRVGDGPSRSIAPPTSVWSDAQRQEMQERSRLAGRIISHVAADAERKHADAWQLSLTTLLYQTPSRSLQAMDGTASTLDDAIRLADATVHGAVASATDKALGSPADSLVFTPITPCRYIDTRNFGGPIVAPRDFSIARSGASYGGNGGCQLPANTDAAIAINATIVVPAGPPGYLGLRPIGDASVTSFINWLADGTTGTANAGIIATAPNAADAGAYTFEAFAGGGNNPQLIVDVFGYFAAPVPVACAVALGANTTIAAGNSDYVYSPSCSNGYAVSSGGCQATNFATQLVGFQPAGNAYECTYYNSSSAPQTVRAFAYCCQQL